MIDEALIPLKPHLASERVSEVMVYGDGRIETEQKGIMSDTGERLDDAQMMRIGLALAAHEGRDFAPLMNGSLPTGERYQWTSEPVTRSGSTLTIRVQAEHSLTFSDFGLTEREAQNLVTLITHGGNLVVSGGTGSGKTSLVSLILKQPIFAHPRCLVIEDQAEIHLPNSRSIRMQFDDQHTARMMMRAAVRMRPDHIILGEVRDAEAFELLQAVNTGHAGSVCTVHASSGGAAQRLADLASYSGRTILPERFKRSFSGVVHVHRNPDNTRTALFTPWSIEE